MTRELALSLPVFSWQMVKDSRTGRVELCGIAQVFVSRSQNMEGKKMQAPAAQDQMFGVELFADGAMSSE